MDRRKTRAKHTKSQRVRRPTKRYIEDTGSEESDFEQTAPAKQGRHKSSRGRVRSRHHEYGENPSLGQVHAGTSHDVSGSETEADPLEDRVQTMVQSMLAASLPAVVKEVMEATKTSSLEANKSAQGQAATNDQDNDQELQERNATETSMQQSAVDSAVQQQTVNITAGKLRLPSLPLDLHLTAELKAKIIGNKFVKFGQLISKDTPEEDKMQLQVAHTPQVSNTQQLEVTPQQAPVRIRDIDTWGRAFDIYCYAYLAKHTTAGRALVHYGRVIKDMAWKGHQWLNYDESFRKLRETDDELYPWDKVEPHLWANCTTPRIATHRNNMNGPQPNQFFQQNGPFGPGGVTGRGRGRNFRGWGRGQPAFGRFSGPGQQLQRQCYRFNRGNPCQKPCKFEHCCANCGGNHPVFTCRQFS